MNETTIKLLTRWASLEPDRCAQPTEDPTPFIVRLDDETMYVLHLSEESEASDMGIILLAVTQTLLDNDVQDSGLSIIWNPDDAQWEATRTLWGDSYLGWDSNPARAALRAHIKLLKAENE